MGMAKRGNGIFGRHRLLQKNMEEKNYRIRKENVRESMITYINKDRGD